MVPTDDGAHIQRYMEISWKFSAKPRRRHSRRNGQLTMNLIGTRLQFAIRADLQLLGVGWSDIHAIAWIKITCPTRPDHGFEHKDPMPYGRIDEWVFSYDGRYVTGWIM